MLETTADIFLKEDAHKLLFNKYVLFIGDSGNIKSQHIAF